MKKLLLLLLSIISYSIVNSQNVGIGTTTPKARLHVADSAVLFSGHSSGDIFMDPRPLPMSGTGIRMMWIPTKAAFRVGAAISDEWDKQHIGNYSFAAGQGSKASGLSSTAMGEGSIATGNYGVALGGNNTASGYASTALGNQTKAYGENATSIGSSTFANGFSSLAVGMFNDSMVLRQQAVTSTTPLFIVGNGNSENDRSNALVVLKNSQVGIGTSSPKASAALDISSINKGLLIPRTSATGRTGISEPSKGLLVYDTTHSAFYYYDGGKWRSFYEQNYDSATVNYYNVDGNSVNLLTTTTGSGGFATGNSGFIYDNGGPAANYSTNNYSYRQITFDDSTILVKITVEEMNAETFFDSLYIIQAAGVDNYTDTVASFTGTQTGTVTVYNNVRIYFKAKNTTNLAGFKIRWARMRLSGVQQISPPLYGWYFNNAKLAAMGGLQKYNNWHNDSVGFGSINYGIGNKAKGYGSVAIGYNTTANKNYSVAMGHQTEANGDFSTSLGTQTEANGDYSIAMGYNTKARGYGSTAMGYGTLAHGFYSTAMGMITNAQGEHSTAMGYGSDAVGIMSTAMGHSTTATGRFTTAMGLYTNARGEISTAMGRSTYANGYASLVAGIYNDTILTKQGSITSTTPLFIIGNGDTSYSRSNAMVVLKNGNVAIGNNGNPVNRLHITGGTDLDLPDNSGFMTIGDVGGANMVFDQNEIQARSNGAVANLFIQGIGGNVRLANNTTGQVHIGTAPAAGVDISALRLYVNGTAGKSSGSSWTVPSDKRLKQNILPYSDGLQQVLKINPVRYHYNAASGFDTKPEHVGIIAQELQAVAPYMVITPQKTETDYLSVDNTAMTYMLINAVKELKAEIETLKLQLKNRSK
ncbi:MAG: tail fiber domain-containing protein [Bacteroidota bacterium]